VYYLMSFPIVTGIYYYATGRTHPFVFLTIAASFTTFALLNVFFIQRSEFNSYTSLTMSILLIFYGLYYFSWLLKELPTTVLYKLPMFWINSALIIFSAGNMFYYGLLTYLVKVLNNNLMGFSTFHNMLGILSTSMFMVALLIDLKKID